MQSVRKKRTAPESRRSDKAPNEVNAAGYGSYTTWPDGIGHQLSANGPRRPRRPADESLPHIVSAVVAIPLVSQSRLTSGQAYGPDNTKPCTLVLGGFPILSQEFYYQSIQHRETLISTKLLFSPLSPSLLLLHHPFWRDSFLPNPLSSLLLLLRLNSHLFSLPSPPLLSLLLSILAET
jgi:hypothetical protein